MEGGTAVRRVRGRCIGAALVATILAGAVVPALAGAEWTTPVNVSSYYGTNLRDPQVAVDSDGRALFTWAPSAGESRVKARVRRANSTLGWVQKLSNPGNRAYEPQVAVDPNGRAVFTWRVSYNSIGARDRIQARVRRANGTLSPVQNLSNQPLDPGGDAGGPQVAVDPNGRAVFAWVGFDGTNDRIQARTRSATGTLGAVQNISNPGRNATEPQVAVDAHGRALFTWVGRGGGESRIQARVLRANGTLGPLQNLSDPAEDSDGPQVAVDPNGRAVFTWLSFDGARDRVKARVRRADGTLGAVQNISDPGRNATEPQVAIDPTGTAVLAWTSFAGIQARTLSNNGTLSPVQDISDHLHPGEFAQEVRVAVDARGKAVFVWRAFDDDFDFRVWTRSRSPAGALRPATILSEPSEDVLGAIPQVAVDPGGDAHVVWVRYHGQISRIQASAGP